MYGTYASVSEHNILPFIIMQKQSLCEPVILCFAKKNLLLVSKGTLGKYDLCVWMIWTIR